MPEGSPDDIPGEITGGVLEGTFGEYREGTSARIPECIFGENPRGNPTGVLWRSSKEFLKAFPELEKISGKNLRGISWCNHWANFWWNLWKFPLKGFPEAISGAYSEDISARDILLWTPRGFLEVIHGEVPWRKSIRSNHWKDSAMNPLRCSRRIFCK